MPLREALLLCFRRVNITQRGAAPVVLAPLMLENFALAEESDKVPSARTKWMYSALLFTIALLRHCVPLSDLDARFNKNEGFNYFDAYHVTNQSVKCVRNSMVKPQRCE